MGAYTFPPATLDVGELEEATEGQLRDIAIGVVNVYNDVEGIAKASTAMDKTTAAARRSNALSAVLMTMYDGATVCSDLAALIAQIQQDIEGNPEVLVSELSQTYLDNENILANLLTRRRAYPW